MGFGLPIFPAAGRQQSDTIALEDFLRILISAFTVPNLHQRHHIRSAHHLLVRHNTSRPVSTTRIPENLLCQVKELIQAGLQAIIRRIKTKAVLFQQVGFLHLTYQRLNLLLTLRKLLLLF